MALLLCAAAVAYLMMIYAAFVVEAVGGEIGWRSYPVAIGAPLIAAGIASAAGLFVARRVASALARSVPAACPAGVVGVGAALLGGAVAAGFAYAYLLIPA